jgi:hypothetical protein
MFLVHLDPLQWIMRVELPVVFLPYLQIHVIKVNIIKLFSIGGSIHLNSRFLVSGSAYQQTKTINEVTNNGNCINILLRISNL